jgi:hypothetical protein
MKKYLLCTALAVIGLTNHLNGMEKKQGWGDWWQGLWNRPRIIKPMYVTEPSVDQERYNKEAEEKARVANLIAEKEEERFHSMPYGSEEVISTRQMGLPPQKFNLWQRVKSFWSAPRVDYVEMSKPDAYPAPEIKFEYNNPWYLTEKGNWRLGVTDAEMKNYNDLIKRAQQLVERETEEIERLTKKLEEFKEYEKKNRLNLRLKDSERYLSSVERSLATAHSNKEFYLEQLRSFTSLRDNNRNVRARVKFEKRREDWQKNEALRAEIEGGAQKQEKRFERIPANLYYSE